MLKNYIQYLNDVDRDMAMIVDTFKKEDSQKFKNFAKQTSIKLNNPEF